MRVCGTVRKFWPGWQTPRRAEVKTNSLPSAGLKNIAPVEIRVDVGDVVDDAGHGGGVQVSRGPGLEVKPAAIALAVGAAGTAHGGVELHGVAAQARHSPSRRVQRAAEAVAAIAA